MINNLQRYTNEYQVLFEIVNDAIQEFNHNHNYLVENDLSERCICARFAIILENRIKNTVYKNDYFVDVEYNRGMYGNNHCIKELNGKKVVLDIIVHKRGFNNLTGFDNLICIEMKKPNRKNIDKDKERLKCLTSNLYGYCYKAGFMIIINNKGLEIESAYYLHNDDEG